MYKKTIPLPYLRNSFVWLLCLLPVAHRASGATVVRTFSRSIARTNSSIEVTATVTTGSAGLRGFSYTDQVPSGLSVTPIRVSINGVAVSNFVFERGQSSDVYAGCTPCRFILERPTSFAQANPVPGAGTVRFVYSINSPNVGVFRLRHFSWSALSADTAEPVFDFSSNSAQASIAFVGSTSTLPTGAFWTLFWQHSNGSLSRWNMVGTTMVGHSPLNPVNLGSQWLARAGTDLNNDGEPDMIFQHSDGRLFAWTMDNLNRVSAMYLNPAQARGWKLMAATDVNGNAQEDLFFQHTNNTLAVWTMSGNTAVQSSFLNPSSAGAGWRLAGTGNFLNGSDRQLLFQHKDGWLAVWAMNGTNRVRASFLNPSKVDPKWKVAATVDLTGDGRHEILFRHDNGQLAYWRMAGTNRVSGGGFTPGSVDPAWRIVGAK